MYTFGRSKTCWWWCDFCAKILSISKCLRSVITNNYALSFQWKQVFDHSRPHLPNSYKANLHQGRIFGVIQEHAVVDCRLWSRLKFSTQNSLPCPYVQASINCCLLLQSSPARVKRFLALHLWIALETILRTSSQKSMVKMSSRQFSTKQSWKPVLISSPNRMHNARSGIAKLELIVRLAKVLFICPSKLTWNHYG